MAPPPMAGPRGGSGTRGRESRLRSRTPLLHPGVAAAGANPANPSERQAEEGEERALRP